jgi:hypothetical protein
MKRESGATDAPGISVHVDALEAFAQAVDAVMSDHVHGVSTVATVLGSGVPFGLYCPSGDVQAAKTAYGDAATGLADQLRQFVIGLTIMADAARQISARYRTVDALRRASVEDIELTIGTVVGRDTPLPQVPGQEHYS